MAGWMPARGCSASSAASLRAVGIQSKRRFFGSRNNHEGVAGGWSSLWPPDPPLEPEDEGIHLRRAQWNPHYRFAKDIEDVSRRQPVLERVDRARPDGPLCRNQAAGARSDQ